MFSDSDPRGEVPDNDGIEQHEDEEWQPEEQTDDGQKEGFCPRWFNISCAGWVVRVIFIFSNSQDGGRGRTESLTGLIIGVGQCGTVYVFRP